MITIPRFEHPVFPVFYLAGAILFTIFFFVKGRNSEVKRRDQLYFFAVTIFLSVLFSKILNGNFIAQLPSFFSTGQLNFDFAKSTGGGIAGALLALIICSRLLRSNQLQELFFPGWLIGLAAIKIGCLLEGCCFGIPIHGNFGVEYLPGSFTYYALSSSSCIADHAASTGTLFPSQLLDIVCCLLTILITVLIVRKNRMRSAAFTSLIVFLLFRITSDYLRGLREPSILTSYQFMLLGMVFAIIIISRYFSRLRYTESKENVLVRFSLLVLFSLFTAFQSQWFTRAETYTILILAVPAAIFALAGSFASQSVVGKQPLRYVLGTWIVILSMSQISADSVATDSTKPVQHAETTSNLIPIEKPNMWSADSSKLHTIEAGGMGGMWTDICGGVHGYGAVGGQYSYSAPLSTRARYTLGAGGFVGQTDYNDYKYFAGTNANQTLMNQVFAVRTFFRYDSKNTGFQIGLMGGQIMIMDGLLTPNFSIGERVFSVYPCGSVRLGNKIYFNVDFGNNIAGNSAGPMAKVGLGFFGKKNLLNSYNIGLSDAGIFFNPKFGFKTNPNTKVGLFISFFPGIFNGSVTASFGIPNKK